MNRRLLSRALPAIVTIALVCGYLAMAGDLNPPAGPITPTMKTLVDVEPRMVIDATNTPGDADSTFKITQSGSYYLTGNLTGQSGKSGIEVAAANVSIDLMGQALIGVAGSLSGITSTGGSSARIVVRNGIVRGWGTAGVQLNNDDCAASEMVAEGNGTQGIRLGDNARIHDCTARSNGTNGIHAGHGSLIEHCISRANTGDGIFAGGPTSDVNILNCVSSQNTGDGIEVSNRSIVRGNNCGANGLAIAGDGAGIHVGGSNNRIEDNTCIGADRGLDIDGTDNYIAENIVRQNTDNYDIVAGNQLNILLCQIPESIDWPASVSVNGDQIGVSGQSGITVNSSDVTIDLGGHSLRGVAGSLDGIRTTGTASNVTIRNGMLSQWGAKGIYLDASFNDSHGSLLEDVHATGNGSGGISSNRNSVIRACRAESNVGFGIAASFGCIINNCTASSNTGAGIIAQSTTHLNGCVANLNSDLGIWVVNSGSTITNCSAQGNTTNGIQVSFGNTVTSCTASGNDGDGLVVAGGCYAFGNTCASNDGAGIRAVGADTRIDGNNVVSNQRGIEVVFGGNMVVRNSASDNVTNYQIAIGNAVGQILMPTTNAAAISGNTYSAGIGSNNPWANFAQ